MDTVRLGRTGLEVSVAGLGCGGHSRLGQSQGATEAESIALVRGALDAGVTLVDTARAYGTEEIVGKALAGRRDGVVVSTKVLPEARGSLLDRSGLLASLDKSLRRLGTDVVDVFHLHGVSPDAYDHCLGELVPAMADARDAGKIRFLAISEQFASDPGHTMLTRAVTDGCWDVMMVGFNVLNPSARHRVFTTTRADDVGVLVMFAVRRVLARPDDLRALVAELAAQGVLGAEVDVDDPLGFLVRAGGAESIVDAAYRFARHEPGVHVVLTGTGSADHLEQNLASLLRGPLPAAELARLGQLFGAVDTVSGN